MAKCPYCKKKVDLENIKVDIKLMGNRRMYSCPHCDCILSFSLAG